MKSKLSPDERRNIFDPTFTYIISNNEIPDKIISAQLDIRRIVKNFLLVGFDEKNIDKVRLGEYRNKSNIVREFTNELEFNPNNHMIKIIHAIEIYNKFNDDLNGDIEGRLFIALNRKYRNDMDDINMISVKDIVEDISEITQVLKMQLN